MAYTIKPSIGMLPIDDIATVMQEKGFLNEISSNHIEQVTRKEIVSSGETTYAPGIFEPYNIALCTGEVENGEIDRETVKNALNLSGRKASDYLVVEDKESLISKNNALSQIYSNEIQLLRDELYYLKSELSKLGQIEDTNVSKGYIDSFKKSKIKYDINETQITEVSGESIKQLYNIFDKNDYIAVHKDESNVDTITIDNVVSESGNSIVLKNGTASISTTASILKRSLGEYKSGTYSFSKTMYDVVGTKERYTGLNDDIDLVEKSMLKNNTGFATIVRIPSRNNGFLTKFIAQGRKIGNPGALTCYVIKGDADSLLDMSDKNKITEAILNNKYFAKSSPVYEVDKKDKEIIFDFSTSYTIADSESFNQYPEIMGGTEYCFIIESSNVSEDDYWNIEFGTNKGGDLQTNNKTFCYYRDIITNIDNNELEPLEDDRDMFYTVITKEKEEEAEIPYRCGLYTTAIPINLSQPIKATRARLTLEINKEGNFYPISKGLMRKNIDTIEFRQVDTGNMAEQTVINGGDKVVIGNKIVNVVSSTPGSLVVDETLYVDEVSSIYRVGYEAQVKVRNVQIDPSTFTEIVKEGSERVLPLKLTAVIPSGRDLSSPISDRLIFETEIEDFNKIQKIADKCDVDGDGVVSEADGELVASYYGNTDEEILKKYDINEDGVIDSNDLALVSKYNGHIVGESISDEFDFNEAILQIKWNGNLTSESSRLQLKKGNDFVGRISNLSLAFDKIM